MLTQRLRMFSLTLDIACVLYIDMLGLIS